MAASGDGWRRATTRFCASHPGLVLVGLAFGALAALLQKAGNPPNMGICMACFKRDIAGALRLHSAAAVQYLRPEIMGGLFGAMAAAILFGEFRPRGGSSPIVRFMLGTFAMIGSLVFLGCPWRALLRLAGGDANALVGLAGLVAGVGLGAWFLKHGFTLGRSRPAGLPAGLIMPLVMAFLTVLLVAKMTLGHGQSGFLDRAIAFSSKGPGAMRAPVLMSLGAGLVLGLLAQRSRFCTVGSIRDAVLIRDFHLLGGALGFIVSAVLVNLATGQFAAGVRLMPISHSHHLWNFLGMVLAGLAFALGGGCPGRQLFVAGEGDTDAGVFVLGMFVGAAVSHNLMLAGLPDRLADGAFVRGGPGLPGQIAVAVGLAFCVAVGLTARERER